MNSDSGTDASGTARDAVAASEARCAQAIGRLEGRITSMSVTETSLFCLDFLRHALLSALTSAGFADAPLCFDQWFARTGRGPAETVLTDIAPGAIVRAILAELSLHPWEPLADAAQYVRRMGSFASDRDDADDDKRAAESVSRAAALVARAASGSDEPLPFPALGRLVKLVSEDLLIAPREREVRMLTIGGRTVSYEQSGARSPLWALDLAVGTVLAAGLPGMTALPCPGAIIPGVFQSDPGSPEQRVAVADAIRSSTGHLVRSVETARQRARLLAVDLGHLRSNARAPAVWMAAIGFAPLGIEQISKGFGISRRGTYTIVDALVAAGLAERVRSRGAVLLKALERQVLRLPAGSSPSFVGRSSLLAEFDAAMSEVDRLLARNTSGCP